jgi:DNA processing protein
VTAEQAELGLHDPAASASDDERAARAALAAAVEPGAVGIARGMAKIGPKDMVAVLRRGAPGKLDMDRRVQRRLRYVDGSRILEETDRAGARFVCPGDPEWPDPFTRLAATLGSGDAIPPPFGIWLRGSGNLPDLAGRSVAIVGARAATSYGRSVASETAADLSVAGWTVVSGGAYGIDGAAHRGALAAGRPTIAVLACGIDIAYPRGHTDLLERITSDGLLLTERPPGADPSRPGFLKRNRLIAGLTAGTIVVEAARRSGALSTAEWAGKLNRPVGIVPGPVTSAQSVGCHKLARESGATVVTNAVEIADLIGAYGTDAAPDEREPDNMLDRLSEDERDIYEAMPGSGATTVDELCRATGMTARACLASLASLSELGLVTSAPYGWMVDQGARRRTHPRQEGA